VLQRQPSAAMVVLSRSLLALAFGASIAPNALAVEDSAANSTEAEVVSTTVSTTSSPVEEPEALPPLVEFVGRKPRLKVYPGGTKDKESTWYMLEFGAVEEVDSKGRRVRERSIRSLAAEKRIKWTQNAMLVGGTGATTTRMELHLNETFDKACRGGQGRMPDDTSVISVETFVFAGRTTIKYGNETLKVLASSLKYNVRSANWPFCEEGNKLRVKMEVKVKGTQKPKFEDKDMEAEDRMARPGKGGKRGKGLKGKKFRANAGKMDLEMDLPTLSVVDGKMLDSEVDLEVNGGKTEVLFTFPHFGESLLYDPTAELSEPEIGDNSTMTTDVPTTVTTSSTPMKEPVALPPLVEFVGKSPKLKVYPGGTKDKESTWYQLEFGAVEEIDSNGKVVKDRSIKSLAAEKDITWMQDSIVFGETGTTATKMELYLNKTFDKPCKGGQGRTADENSVISVETFVFSGPATIDYGNET